MDRQEAGHHVDDGARYEKGGNTAWTLGEQRLAIRLDIGQSTDAGTHGDTHALAIAIVDLETAVTHGLEAGSETVLDEQIQLAGFLRGQVLLHVESLDRSADPRAEGRDVHMLDRRDTAATGQDAFPAARHIGAKRRYHAHTRDHDTSTRHTQLLLSFRGGHPS